MILATNISHLDKTTYNQCVKIYGDFYKIITFNKPIYNPNGVPTDKPIDRDYNKDKNNTRNDSLKRAKDKIFDIAFCNNFTYFVTLTLDNKKVNRYDYVTINKKLKNWLGNQVKRKNANYLIVPELHKDGAVHFHGLMSGDFNCTDSGKKDKSNRIIYNLNDWSLGYTTAVICDNNKVAIAHYITKYITKDLCKILDNIYYAGGKDLIRDVPTEYYNVDYKDCLGNEYSVANTNMLVKYFNIYDDEV